MPKASSCKVFDKMKDNFDHVDRDCNETRWTLRGCASVHPRNYV